MASYYAETKLSPEKAIQKAIAYFGKGGVGLETMEKGSCCAHFEGSGGHILVAVSDGPKTRVDLETREWDYAVRQFMRRIA
jgi:hypothetical protein